MDYTFTVRYKSSDSNYRSKSVVHFNGNDLDDIMKQVTKFKYENPEYTIGAGSPGLHTTIP